ncbi:hypothetical protein ACE1SV_48280 [Streptomyces sp. E-15]
MRRAGLARPVRRARRARVRGLQEQAVREQAAGTHRIVVHRAVVHRGVVRGVGLRPVVVRPGDPGSVVARAVSAPAGVVTPAGDVLGALCGVARAGLHRHAPSQLGSTWSIEAR